MTTYTPSLGISETYLGARCSLQRLLCFAERNELC